MLSVRFGGAGGREVRLQDTDDLVVIRTKRRGARHDVSPLSPRVRDAQRALRPLFGSPPAGVGVYETVGASAGEIAPRIADDPAIEFAGRGLRDEFGRPVVYTENLFVKFADGVDGKAADALLRRHGVTVKRALPYAGHAYFAAMPEGSGRAVFDTAGALLEEHAVELCHPELLREISYNAAYPQQWHLEATEIGGERIDQDAAVVEAWARSLGDGTVIAIIDDGVDIDHREFTSGGKVVAPRSVSNPVGDDPRPSQGANHGTACAGVACANGEYGASGVAPGARLMPVRFFGLLGSQEEADAFAWAADNGADVISCSWGPPDGAWWDESDPAHDRVDPLPDSTRLAIDYAVAQGRGGRGCVITWAAGNGNESVDNDGYASYEKVIAVAACNDMGTRSAYSDKGDALWVAFPSSHGDSSLTPGIWTTDRSGTEGYNSGDQSMGDAEGDYTNSFGGTSSACPGVAGVAALIVAANPDLSAQQVKEILRDSADRIDDQPGEYDAQGHSKQYGYGRVNAANAVDLATQYAGAEAEAARA